MKETTLISIIIPIYNCEKYLHRCIKSVLLQTYKNLQVLLIDDGSTDNSAIICNEYANNDDRIEVFHLKNGGVSNARNFGVQKARGKFIGFVDADDFIELNMYEKLWQKAIEQDSDMVFCRFKRFQVEGEYVVEDLGVEEFVKTRNIALFIANKNKTIMGSACRILFKKNFIDGFHFDTSIILGEDLLFVLEAITSTSKISYVEDALYNYYYVNTHNCFKYLQNENYLNSQQILTEKVVDILNKSGRIDLVKYRRWDTYITTLKTLLLAKDYDIRIKNLKRNVFWRELNSRENYTEYKKIKCNLRNSQKLSMLLIHHNLFFIYKLLLKIKECRNG